MARLTASDMVDMVRDCLGGETTETISDTRILRYINQSYLELASEYAYPQLSTSTTITTADGTAAYELSVSNLLRFTDIVNSTIPFTLRTMSENQYHDFTQGSTSNSGTPVYWYVSGVGSNDRYEVTFWPTPAGTYTLNVHYVQAPDELETEPTATSAVIPEPWDDSIIHRAVSRGWRMLGDLETAGKWLSLARNNDRAAKKSTFQASQIVISPGSVVGRALQDV